MTTARGNHPFLVLLAAILFFMAARLGLFPQETSIWENAPVKKVLSNGITLISHRDESTAFTVLQFLIKGGTGAVPEGKDGLSYLTTRLVIEIPDRNKIQDLMKQASSVSMTCRGDYSLITLVCLSENLENTLKIVTKLIQDPLFSSLRIGGIKEYMEYRARSDEDDSIIKGHNTHLRAFFGGQGYGSAVLGTEGSPKNIQKRDIDDFYKTYFTAANTIISVSSDWGEGEVAGILEKYLGSFPQGKPVEGKPRGPVVPEEKKISLEKLGEQTYLSVAYPLPGTSRKNFVLATLVENLLGKGVNSRLWVLRSQEKLAYNVNAHAVQMKEGGILKAYLETENEKRERACEALKRILLTIHEQGITEEEFQATRTSAKAQFLRMNESKADRTANLAYFEAVGLGYEYLEAFFSELEAVSFEEMNAYVKEIINPDRGVEVIIGPKNE